MGRIFFLGRILGQDSFLGPDSSIEGFISWEGFSIELLVFEKTHQREAGALGSTLGPRTGHPGHPPPIIQPQTHLQSKTLTTTHHLHFNRNHLTRADFTPATPPPHLPTTPPPHVKHQKTRKKERGIRRRERERERHLHAYFLFP